MRFLQNILLTLRPWEKIVFKACCLSLSHQGSLVPLDVPLHSIIFENSNYEVAYLHFEEISSWNSTAPPHALCGVAENSYLAEMGATLLPLRGYECLPLNASHCKESCQSVYKETGDGDSLGYKGKLIWCILQICLLPLIGIYCQVGHFWPSPFQ